MARACKSVERYTLDDALRRLPRDEAHARTLLARLAALGPLPAGAEVLDIGAGQGLFLVACAKLGCRAVGLEPWPQALDVAAQLAEREHQSITIIEGVAEKLPFADERFDVVHAKSVIEHVRDPAAVFREVRRVLKPGGRFWFYTASSLCPRQDEIRGFPCFGWYPDRLKRRIMTWAAARRPHLIGHAAAPALHWFTPFKARRMLRSAGFAKVYDRWDLPPLPTARRLRRLALGLIRSTPVTKLLADVLVSACSYTAVK